MKRNEDGFLEDVDYDGVTHVYVEFHDHSKGWFPKATHNPSVRNVKVPEGKPTQKPSEWKKWTPTPFAGEKIGLQCSFSEDYDEERWKKMHPGKAYPGFVPDLACKQGSKVWKGGYVRDPRTGQEGPIIRNKAERDEYCKLTGHRALEPREVPVSKENGMKAIAKELGAKCADYYRRMHS